MMRTVFCIWMLMASSAMASFAGLSVKRSELISDKKILESVVDCLEKQKDVGMNFDKGFLTINCNPKTGEYEFTAEISYCELEDWLSEEHVDLEKEGWEISPPSTSPKSYEISRCVSLLATLDHNKVKYNKLGVKRCRKKKSDQSPGEVLAVWNFLKFKVPRDRASLAGDIIKAYSQSFAEDSEVSISLGGSS